MSSGVCGCHARCTTKHPAQGAADDPAREREWTLRQPDPAVGLARVSLWSAVPGPGLGCAAAVPGLSAGVPALPAPAGVPVRLGAAGPAVPAGADRSGGRSATRTGPSAGRILVYALVG